MSPTGRRERTFRRRCRRQTREGKVSQPAPILTVESCSRCRSPRHCGCNCPVSAAKTPISVPRLAFSSHSIRSRFDPAKKSSNRNFAESAILSFLHKGGTLTSVENVLLDGKHCVRVELEVAHPVGRPASNSTAAPNRTAASNSTAAPNRSATAGNENQTAATTPPEARRYIYYLDPNLHCEVRRLETRSKPDTLLNRTDCSQFEQIPGRQLWLPRKVESELHELPTLPGTVLKKEESATQILEVSAFDGSRAPDETFTLNYTQPGTIVHDGTDAGSTKSGRGFIRYTAPAPGRPAGRDRTGT